MLQQKFTEVLNNEQGKGNSSYLKFKQPDLTMIT